MGLSHAIPYYGQNNDSSYLIHMVWSTIFELARALDMNDYRTQTQLKIFLVHSISKVWLCNFSGEGGPRLYLTTDL
jgi:hypothetical protein